MSGTTPGLHIYGTLQKPDEKSSNYLVFDVESHKIICRSISVEEVAYDS